MTALPDEFRILAPLGDGRISEVASSIKPQRPSEAGTNQLTNMQEATVARLHVRDAHDAHTLFEAVRRGLLCRVTRRLNEMERNIHIHSGACFVWEEGNDETGLRRWTDGKVWGPSRMREPYLYYDEKIAANSLNSGCCFSNDATVEGSTHQNKTQHEHGLGLVKQAYSAFVRDSASSTVRKWHLTCYFSLRDLPNIPTIAENEMLSSISKNIPRGVFRCGKKRSKREPEFEQRIEKNPRSNPSSCEQRELCKLPVLEVKRIPRVSEDQRLIHMLNARYNR